MTYLPRFNKVRTECLNTSEVHSSNWMPQMMREPRLAHLAECKTCFDQLNEDAKKRVASYKRDITKLELTEAKQLLEQRP